MTLDHWEQQEPILLAFEDSWRSGAQPSIDEQLPGVPAEQRIELLAELVMIDFEHRCTRGLSGNLDEYFERFPELLQQPQLRDELIRHEFQIRRKAGSFPDEAELASRFPNDTTIVELRNQIDSKPANVTHVSSLLRPGTMVGNYRIEACLGAGAFASVYAAFDTQENRRAALKFLSQSAELRPEWRIRLIREAQAVAMLQHANVVPIIETGSFEGHDFIASKIVDGITLSVHMRASRMPRDEAIKIARQLASALEHAHRHGIVHRDIKPANIMLENGVPMLLDFGLAHFVDASQKLTHEGDLLGTPAYMSPEQADGRAWCADARSDVYSLGAVLYHMICGRAPFEGSTSEVIHKALTQEPTAPRELNAEVNRDLQTVILKCLEKEPSQRYQTAAELENDLTSVLEDKPIRARAVGFAGHVARWARRRPVVASLGAGILALGLFLCGLSTQLFRVASERDRAQTAELTTQSLLAESAADAGQLAMQRGHVDAAINHFEQCLERGHEDVVGIQLKLVEAHLIRRNIDEAVRCWQTANQAFSRQDASAQPATLAAIQLWKAELALEGHANFGNGEELMVAVQDMALGEAEESYVEGVLAEASPDAVAALRAATRLDPFHHRARRLLIVTLFSLARLDETEAELLIARQLFPEDTDFLLLDCLCTATQGDLDIALSMLEGADLDSDSMDGWKSFCRTLHGVKDSVPMDAGVGELNTRALADLATQFLRDFLPLIRERKWRFPPKVGKRFTDLVADLPRVLQGDYQDRAAAIESLTAVHPESSLLHMLGGLRLADARIDSDDREEQIRYFEEAREAFQLAMEHSGFTKSSDQLAWKAIFTTSLILTHSYQHENESNRKEVLNAARHVDSTTITQPRHARTFAIMTLTLEDYDEAARWINRWVEVSNSDRKTLIDAHYHRAILCKRLENWTEVRKACDEVLALDPSFGDAIGLRDTAIRHMKEVVNADAG